MTADMGRENNSVLVVITTYNRGGFLTRCVESVLASDYGSPLNVVIVDDCSTDDTQSRCLELCSQHRNVHYCRNSENCGHAYGRNKGVYGFTNLPHDYILFLDDDNIVERDAIGKLVAFCAKKGDCGMVSPLAVKEDCGGELWSLGADYHPWLTIPRQWKGSTHRANETLFASNCYLVSGSAFLDICGFDVRLRIFEDADIQFRLRNALGLKTYILPTAITHHYHGVGGKPSELRKIGVESARRAYWMQYYRCLFWKLHYPTLNWLFVCLFSCPALCCYYAAKTLRRGEFRIAASLFVGWLAGAAASLFEKKSKSQRWRD